MCRPEKIISSILTSALVVYSASVTGGLLTFAIYTTEEDIADQYSRMDPPKAYAIARDPSGRGWIGAIAWAEPDVDVARARALSRCRQIAGEMQATCEIRDARSELPPLSPSGKPQAEYFPYRLTGLTHKSVLQQSVVDKDIEMCGANDNLREHDGGSFVNLKFIRCMRSKGYGVFSDRHRTTSDCQWIDLSDSSPYVGYWKGLRCGTGWEPRTSVSKSSPATTPPESKSRPKLVPSKLVRDVQESLRKLGYSPSLVDGLLGPITIAAVKAFQRDLEVTPTGAISEELLFALKVVVAVQAADEPTETQAKLKLIGSGSGFLVNNTGYALTNQHVIADCTAVAVVIDGESQQVKLAATDESNDLALLKLPGTFPNVAKFRESRRAILGESVLVAGYPLRGVLAKRLNVSTGTVSSLAGIGDDARYLQISAPVQLGNSGGPLLDKSASIIGVVVAKLDALKVAKITGQIPQNVNFAIKGVIARGFLDIHGIEYDTSRASNVLETTEIAAAARHFTVPVECWK